jgi:hypothetical protein
MLHPHRPTVRTAETVANSHNVSFLRVTGIVALFGLMWIGAGHAHAAPTLQLYIEGATYDDGSESWVISPPGSSGGAPFRLWAIGNVDGPGGKGTIENVRLSVVYDYDPAAGIPHPTISLTPTTTGGYGGFFDPSVPINATLLQTRIDGSTPVLGDGNSLPSHGEYGPGRAWQEFALGDFTLEDSPSGDFIDSFPVPSSSDTGSSQINVYEISVLKQVSGPFEVHFDLYDTIASKNHVQARFAPFSHDADATATIVPEPSALAIWSLLGVFALAKCRRPKRT